MDLGSHAVPQLKMASHKIGVKVTKKDVADLKIVPLSVFQVTVNVALWINYNCSVAGLFVPNQIGSVREAAEVILFENHGIILPRVFTQFLETDFHLMDKVST